MMTVLSKVLSHLEPHSTVMILYNCEREMSVSIMRERVEGVTVHKIGVKHEYYSCSPHLKLLCLMCDKQFAKIDGRNQILNAHRDFEYCRLGQTSRNEGKEISISDVQTDKRPRTFL